MASAGAGASAATVTRSSDMKSRFARIRAEVRRLVKELEVATLDRFLSVKTAFLALTELLEPEPTGGAHGKPNDAPTGGMELRFLELGVEIRRIAAELEVATVERFARLGGDLKALLALIDAPFVADRATSAVPRSRMTLLSVSPECLCVRPVMGGTFATYEPGSVPLQVGLSAPRKKAGPQLPYVAVVPVAYDDGYGGGQVHRQLPEGFDHARWAQEVLSVRDEVLVDTFTDDGVRRETWEQAVCIPLHLTSEPSAGSNASPLATGGHHDYPHYGGIICGFATYAGAGLHKLKPSICLQWSPERIPPYDLDSFNSLSLAAQVLRDCRWGPVAGVTVETLSSVIHKRLCEVFPHHAAELWKIHFV